jgi:hypothetical protein
VLEAVGEEPELEGLVHLLVLLDTGTPGNGYSPVSQSRRLSGRSSVELQGAGYLFSGA